MFLNFISKYFPPPKFLNPHHTGVSFSDKNIKAIHFNKSGLNLNLKSLIVPIDRGVIENGNILDENALLEGLKKVKSFFKSNFVFFAVPDESSYIYNLSIPYIQGMDVRENISYTIEENVPISIDDAIFDFKAIGLNKNENKDTLLNCLVSVCVKSQVEKFINILNKAEFDVVGCSSESDLVARSVVESGDLNTYYILHTRENRIGIYLIKNNSVHFSTVRSIETTDDFESSLKDEYSKFIDYCIKYNKDDKNIAKNIFICGEYDIAVKAVSFLEKLEVDKNKIKLANVWSNVLNIESNTPDIKFEDSLMFSGPIGAVLSNIN